MIDFDKSVVVLIKEKRRIHETKYINSIRILEYRSLENLTS